MTVSILFSFLSFSFICTSYVIEMKLKSSFIRNSLCLLKVIRAVPHTAQHLCTWFSVFVSNIETVIYCKGYFFIKSSSFFGMKPSHFFLQLFLSVSYPLVCACFQSISFFSVLSPQCVILFIILSLCILFILLYLYLLLCVLSYTTKKGTDLVWNLLIFCI